MLSLPFDEEVWTVLLVNFMCLEKAHTVLHRPVPATAPAWRQGSYLVVRVDFFQKTSSRGLKNTGTRH